MCTIFKNQTQHVGDFNLFQSLAGVCLSNYSVSKIVADLSGDESLSLQLRFSPQVAF